VLAVDPSSRRTGGSILADKTRMAQLANDANAFIRPSPSSGTLGGVAAKTRETMLLCEAAGYDVVLVETVGVGQSEIAVSDMTDFFLVLALPGAGDELQALKKGVVELADMIAVNKADGDNLARAKLAASQYGAALHILSPLSPNWSPPVITCSALKGTGIEALWAHVLDHRQKLTASGELAALRRSNGCGPCSKSVCSPRCAPTARSRRRCRGSRPMLRPAAWRRPRRSRKSPQYSRSNGFLGKPPLTVPAKTAVCAAPRQCSGTSFDP
jgi:LAO/AO transport system ATPase